MISTLTIYNILSIYDDTWRFSSHISWDDEHPESKMCHVFNPLGKQQERQGGKSQGWNAQMAPMWDEGGMLCRLWGWHTERFLGATSSLQYQPGCVYLHCVAWKKGKKAGELQLDYQVNATEEKGGSTQLNIWVGRSPPGPLGPLANPDYSPFHSPSVCAQRTGCFRSVLRLLPP